MPFYLMVVYIDGRFNLVGDILAAQEAGINLNDPIQRDAFYK